MKIVVFGASSKSGLEVIRQGLAAGHEIRPPSCAIPPNWDRQRPASPSFRAMRSNAAQVEATLVGQDAVITLIGPTKGGPKSVATPTTTNILAAMKSTACGAWWRHSVAAVHPPAWR